MIIEIVLIGIILILCTAVVYYHIKCDKKSDELFDVKFEKETIETNYNKLYNSINEIKESAEEEMQQWKDKIEKECSEELRLKTESLANEYDEALKEEMNNLNREIEEIDKVLGERYKEMMAKNTLLFTCVCDKTRKIPCPIDFSADENRFSCEKCGAEYRVEISAYPILLSNVSSNKTLASLYDN